MKRWSALPKRHLKEQRALQLQERKARLASDNREPAMQTWRKTPYERKVYEKLYDFKPSPLLRTHEAAALLHKLSLDVHSTEVSSLAQASAAELGREWNTRDLRCGVAAQNRWCVKKATQTYFLWDSLIEFFTIVIEILRIFHHITEFFTYLI